MTTDSIVSASNKKPRSRRRRLTRAITGLFVFFLVSFTALHYQNLRRFGYADFKRGAALSLDRSAEIKRRAESFDQTDALESLHALGKNSAPTPRLNVILIVEDSLRADHLSAYGYRRPTSPVKDAFARDGVVFEYAFSQTTKTRPSVPSIMTSLYPTATGVWWARDVLSPSYLTLAEIMRHQGFATASFSQNPNASTDAGLDQGFDTVVEHWGPDVKATNAESFYTDAVFPWVDGIGEENFFMYLHLIDPHAPYNPPRNFRGWYDETTSEKGQNSLDHNIRFDPKWVTAPTREGRNAFYDGEIAYNDMWFGKFLDRLKAQGLYENTLIIFASDHGEYLGEHGMWEHHPPGLIQALHVPLIAVYPPLFPRGKRISNPVQLIDIMPTILEVAGIPTDPLLLQGDSLVSLMQDDPLEFWDYRLGLSEEVVLRNRNDPSEWGSIFHQGWHHIDSDYIAGMPTQKNLHRRADTRSPFTFLKSRFFNYSADPAEKSHDTPMHLDPLLKRSLKNFMHDLQTNNLAIGASIHANDSPSTPSTTTPAPQDLKALQDLGYLDD